MGRVSVGEEIEGLVTAEGPRERGAVSSFTKLRRTTVGVREQWRCWATGRSVPLLRFDWVLFQNVLRATYTKCLTRAWRMVRVMIDKCRELRTHRDRDRRLGVHDRDQWFYPHAQIIGE